MVAKRDVHMPEHTELADKNVPSLHILKALQSLQPQGYATEQFAWRHFSWYLTNEGISISAVTSPAPRPLSSCHLVHSQPGTGSPRPEVGGESHLQGSHREAGRDARGGACAP